MKITCLNNGLEKTKIGRKANCTKVYSWDNLQWPLNDAVVNYEGKIIFDEYSEGTNKNKRGDSNPRLLKIKYSIHVSFREHYFPRQKVKE